jgi:hypothetical protein
LLAADQEVKGLRFVGVRTPDSEHNDDVWTHLLREDFHTHPYQSKTTHHDARVTVRIQDIKDIIEIAFLHSYV